MIRVTPITEGRYWKLRWVDPDAGKVHRMGAGAVDSVTRRDAEQAAAELEHRLNSSPLRGEAVALKVWVEHHRATRDVADRTAAMQDVTFDRYLLPAFGEMVMDRVRPSMVDLWVKGLRDSGLSEWTIMSHVKHARGLWVSAMREVPMVDPFAHVKVSIPKDAPSVPRQLTHESVLRLIDAAGPDWKAAVGLCGLAGLRAGEAALMTWERVVWGRGRLLVPQPKVARSTGRPDRTCRMEPDLERVLLECREQAGKSPRIVTGRVWDSSRAIPPIAVRAGLEPWPDPLKALRRWRVSTWRAQYPADYVNAWCGHSQAVATRHYVEVPDEFYGESEVDRLRRELAELRAKQEVVP